MTDRPSRTLTVLASVWFIAAAALTTRLTFIWYQQSQIPHQVLATVPFEQEAGNIALALSHGDGFANLFRRPTGPTAWLAPVYPFLLFLILRAFGPLTFASFVAAAGLNALFSAATTFPLYAVARRVAGLRVAVASVWMWVVLPAGVLMPFEWIWDTSLSLFLLVALVWLTLRAAESTKLSVWLLCGLLWALALLTNPVLGAGLPFLFAWSVAGARRTLRISWSRPAFSIVIVFFCCLPWTVRNYERFHRLIPIRSSLPFELWIGNNDLFDPHAVGGIQRITRYEETRRYAELGEGAYLDEKRNMAAAFVREKPALFLRLTLRRFLATWAGTEHPYDDFVKTDSVLARSVLIVNLFLTLGTFAGIILLFLRKNPLAVPVAVFPLLYPAVYYVTHTSLRYRHPVDPLLVLLMVFAVAACFGGASSSAGQDAANR